MDARTREEKLLAMARQTASPHEAQIARRLLAEEGIHVDAPTASAPSSSRFMTRDQVLSTPDLYRPDELSRFDYELDLDEAIERSVGRAQMYFGKPGRKVSAS